MRIVYVIDQLDRGGAEQQLVTLCQGMKRRGHDVRVITIHDRLALRNDLDAVDIPISVARENMANMTSVPIWRLRRPDCRNEPGFDPRLSADGISSDGIQPVDRRDSAGPSVGTRHE